MEPKEFDNIINEALLDEGKKVIEEQLGKVAKLIGAIKNAQSLSGMANKIEGVEPVGDGIEIIIKGVSPEELVKCCGGDSLGKAQTNLMQGIHHDLDECGMGGSHDIDINTDGDEQSLGLIIKITPNGDELSIEKETDMDEQTDNGELTNTFGQPLYEDPKDPKSNDDDDEDLLLGDEVEVDEQEQTAAGAMAAEGEINEDHKKIIRLSETEMEKLIENIINEAGVESPSVNVNPGGVPGLDVTKKNRDDSGKENADALKAVEKKIRDYLSFDGNTDPEFPNPVGQGEDKVATQNTDSENDVVDLNRGRNPADLTYDQEPGEPFKERVKLSLVGAAEMGNAQTDEDGNGLGNVIPSKTGENIAKVAEKRKQARVDEPIYDKEAVPVKENPNKKDRPGPESGNAGEAVASDILRMKQIGGYKKTTQ